jgi:hypothetical protein
MLLDSRTTGSLRTKLKVSDCISRIIRLAG